ncbi:MAG: APC family permease [Acidobacteria bacterium]|nr:APC family permease [Acidobacteriota bacterium]
MSAPSANSTLAPSTTSGSFKRVLSLRDLVLFGIAFVSPTAPYALFGIVTEKSNGHIPLVYLIAMTAMSFTAVSYGRMAMAYPEPGSTYTFASRALHPNLGFFAGWGMILDYILIPLLSIIYVGLMGFKFMPQVPYLVWVIVTAMGITAINLRGIEMTARANLVLNCIMIASLIWFAVTALMALASGGGEGLLSSKPFYNPEAFSFGSLMGAASIAVLSFLGFDGISTLAEDAQNGSRDIARATVLVCFICGGLFIGQTYLAQMVWPDYRSFPQVETAFMDVSRRVGGEPLFYFVSLALVVAGLGSSITGQASASRLLCGMGRDRLLPQRLFGYIHPKLGTPVYSVLLMGAVHLCGAAFLKFGEAAEVINFGAFVGFMAVNLSVIRHYFLQLKRRHSGAQLFLNLVFPSLGFGICFYIWLNLSRFALKLGAAWMVLGFFYLLFLTRGFRRSLGELKL